MRGRRERNLSSAGSLPRWLKWLVPKQEPEASFRSALGVEGTLSPRPSSGAFPKPLAEI